MDGSLAIAPAAVGFSRPEWAERARELMRKDEWTASELQALGMAELPSDKKRIHAWMQREGVLFREVAEKGGTAYRYNLYSMPGELRRAIAMRLSPFAFDVALPAGEVPIAARTEDLRALEGLPGKLALRAASRAEAVRAFERWMDISGLVGGRGADRFAQLWAAGGIAIPDWLRAALPDFCAKSLATWRQQFRDQGLRALAGAYKPRVAAIEKSDALADLALGLLAQFPHIDATRVHEAVAEHARALELVVPSLRAVQRWIAGWKADNQLTFAQLRNPDAARSRLMPAFGDAGATATGLNVIWEMDTTPFDVLLEDGKRWTIIGIIDVWSRDVSLRLAETTSGHRARTAFRTALMDLGVPQVLRTDNGSDLRNRETAALLAALGIELPHMTVGRPDRKPFIERLFRTLQHDLVPLLPGYAGHNVAEAQALRARVPFMRQLFAAGAAVQLRMTPATAQAFLDAWVAGYRKREHGSLKMSPEQKRASWPGAVRCIEDARGLDVLLAPLAGGDGWRTVGKKGIAADGGQFAAPALGEMVGERVLCRHDPVDAGRLYVFDDAGRFICAAEDWRLTGTNPQELAEAGKKAWREAVKSGAAELRGKAAKIDKATIALELANRRAAAKPADVVPFPRPAEAHSTPALEQHAAAARAGEARAAPARSAADAARAEFVAARAAKAAERASADSAEAQKAARLTRARALRDAIEAGHAVTDEDRRWFDAYRTGAEWRWASQVEGLAPAACPSSRASAATPNPA